jgi:hypothetical protein
MEEVEIMAPLQKRAMYAFGIGLILVVTLLIVFIIRGDVTTFNEDVGFRMFVYGVLIGVPLVYLIIVNLTLRKPRQVDERDKAIITRAARVQLWAVIFSIVAWVIVLTEIYWEQGEVPVVFLNFIMISTLIISTLAQSLGILIGYWRG